MSLFDAFDLLELLDGLTWRFVVPASIGIGAGLGIYHLSGKDPAGAAVAFALGLIGICVGLVWEFSRARRR
jgi:hypothetical protein